ncbi:MAG TPA: DUF11 domain-containing protein [Gaiellaceae bacterium]|nr:DUF11 domain-containing protein [Gaiellaceae bacterium]
MSERRRTFRRGRRFWPIGLTVAAIVAFGLVFVASSGAILTGSTFEGNDGNMVVNASNHTDWASLAGKSGLQTLVDLPSGQSDNAFGVGSKEDDTQVTVVTGEIPPNKNDLTRAYLYNEVNGSSFLYLAWERAAAIGDAHVDFELNQHATSGFTASTTGKVTLNRTVGDLLIAYDFGGSGTPDITLFKWDGMQWADQQDLSALGYAEAAVNGSAFSDVLNNNAGVDVGDFGEASINLSSALIAAGFSPDTCEAFGSVTVKARSSGSSTTAELKDFIAPAPIHVSNCASPVITTQTSVSSMSIGQTETAGDTATLSDANNPTGDISFQLYSDPGCKHAVAGVGGSAPLNGSGVAVFSGAAFTPAQAGTYYWGVSYAGDNHNNPASACGGSNEEIAVNAPQLSITKTADHTSPVDAGDQIGFTVEVKNTGAGDALGASLNDALPAGSGSGVTWQIDNTVGTPARFTLGGTVGHQSLGLASSTLPAGAVYTVHLVAQTSTSECSVYDNSATLTASNASGAGPASAEESCQSPGIQIAKTPDAAQVDAGSQIGFTVTVYNTGGGAAHGVKLSDLLPANSGLNWSIASQGAGWAGSCAIANGSLTCGGANGVTVPGNLLQGVSSFTVHIVSPTTLATGGTCPGGTGVVTNTGVVSTTNAGSNQATANTCVAAPGVQILKTPDAAQVNAGDPIGFTLTVYNTGTGNANGVKLSDVLPKNAGLNWSIASQGSGWGGSCAIAGGNLTCGGANGVTVPANLSQGASTFTVHIVSPTTSATGGVCPGGSGVVENTGEVTSTNAGSGQSTADTCVAGPGIHIVKTPDAAQVNAGGQIGFTITVYNDGSGDVHGVQLSDLLPTNAGLSWSIAAQGSGWNGTCLIANGVLSCGGTNGVTVPAHTPLAGSPFTVHIVSPTSGATGGDCPDTGVVTNTGEVTSSNGGSAEATASTCVQAIVDLSITKVGSPASQTLGTGNITWMMVVTNNGPSSDTGVTITDPMPAGNTFVSAVSSKGSCTGGASLTCNIGSMAAGEQVVITLVTTPSTVGAQTNTVTVSGNRPETNTANNTATATVQTVGPHTPPTFCVAVSKVSPNQLFVGRRTTLTIHVTKQGKAVPGVRVRIKGAKLNTVTQASNAKGVIKRVVKLRKAGVLVFSPLASKRCNTKRIGVTNVFTPPVTG